MQEDGLRNVKESEMRGSGQTQTRLTTKWKPKGDLKVKRTFQNKTIAIEWLEKYIKN